MLLTKIIVTHSAIVLIFAKNNVWTSLPDAVCHRLLATTCARPATSAPQMARQQTTDRYITIIIQITLIMTIMKPTKLALMLLVGVATTTFVACSNDEERGEIEPIRVELNQVTQTDFAACSNGFANDLLAVLAAQPSAAKGNVVVSPISMQYLLSMMANTASVEAQAEVFDALGLNNYTLAETNRHSKELLTRLQQDDKYVKLALANSIWADDGLDILPEVVANIEDNYNADFVVHDFGNKADEAKRLIDRWASEKTHGLINSLSLKPSSSTAIVLANATYFNGKWSQPFNGRNTYQGVFHNENGTTSKVDMMQASVDAKVYVDDDVSVAELTYGRGYYSMMIVMPKDIGQQITDKTDWWGLHNKLVSATIDIRLPKFKVQNEFQDIVKVCQQLGINKLFEVQSNGVCYVNMGQSAMIDVDENGTKAAAVSYAEGLYTSDKPTEPIKFDHPFVYAIRENTTGTILFIGKVGKL